MLYKKKEENNQLSVSPFVELVSLKYSFPFEYMHSVCLGQMKRLMHYYLTTNFGLFKCKLSSNLKSQLETRVTLWKNCLPREFSRKIRTFKELSYFKATEYRTVLLYTGPVFFRDLLLSHYYEHFLLFHFALYVFASPHFSHFYDAADSCLQKFLFDIKKLFSESEQTYNSHTLSHLYSYVKRFGPVDNFSAFAFENFLYLLEKRIKSGSFVLSQSVNSLMSIRMSYTMNETLRPLFYSSRHPDNCALVSYRDSLTPLLIDSTKHDGEVFSVSGTLLHLERNLYISPYPSSRIGIGIFRKSNQQLLDVIPITKCIVFPHESSYIIVPLASNEII